MNDNPIEFPSEWTPQQALAVLESLYALADALWHAYDDELLQALDDRRFQADLQQLDLPF